MVFRNQKGDVLVTDGVCSQFRDQKGRFLVTDGVRRRVGAAVERSPKVILQPLGVWEAHRMTWSVNGVISFRGPFTLEAHRWPFCGNGAGP